MSDRIKVTIGDISFLLAPMNYMQKQEIVGCTTISSGSETFDLGKAQFIYLKYSVKGVDGLKNYDGSDYELEFEGDNLTDNCVSELFNIAQRDKLTTAAWAILNGISEDEAIDGVLIEVQTEGKLKSGAVVEKL